MGLEAAELARWTRFAAKGGIGKCTATCDCVAESADDLMFLKVSRQHLILKDNFFPFDDAETNECLLPQDDEIIVLLQLPEKDGYYLVSNVLSQLRRDFQPPIFVSRALFVISYFHTQ